jgi:hypothetical protein
MKIVQNDAAEARRVAPPDGLAGCKARFSRRRGRSDLHHHRHGPRIAPDETLSTTLGRTNSATPIYPPQADSVQRPDQADTDVAPIKWTL